MGVPDTSSRPEPRFPYWAVTRQGTATPAVALEAPEPPPPQAARSPRRTRPYWVVSQFEITTVGGLWVSRVVGAAHLWEVDDEERRGSPRLVVHPGTA